MSDSPSGKPKIIVDEDWKGRVQAEKEAAKNEGEQGSAPTDQTGASAEKQAEMPIPEASFSLLITTLATQATAALGQLAPPDAKEVHLSLDLAKHHIDTLEILEEKTKGNLTAEESELLTRFLYELRLLYVAVRNQTRENKGHLES